MARSGSAPLLALLLACALVAPVSAQSLILAQPPLASGGGDKSAWYPPDGLDGDMYCWDAFTPSASATLTEIRWRGMYQIAGTISGFQIALYPGIPAGTQPDVTKPALVTWSVSGMANETYAGTFGGYAMYDYDYTLASPYPLAAGTQYWLQIEAQSTSYPGWAWGYGSGGDGTHFRATTGGTGGGGTLYQSLSGDLAWSLYGTSGATFTIAAGVAPAGAGTVSGAGAYPSGSTATLTATPNAGYGFVDWTEGGVPVSTNPTYAFTVNANRTLVANFTNAWTITTAPSPDFGGTTAGDGTVNAGQSILVSATPLPGFVFTDWEWLGTPLSTSASWSFVPTADMALTARFDPDPSTVVFDFDTGSPLLYPTMGATPMDQTMGGVTAHFEAKAGAFSVQSDASTQFVMRLFHGNYLYPNSAGSQLRIRFNHPLTQVSFTFATADFNQAEATSPVALTAYLGVVGGTPVGTATASGAYIGSTMPMGRLTFQPASPFDIVEITMPPCGTCSSEYLLDNLVATHVPDVLPPVASLIAANGGESWTSGTVQSVLWSASDDYAVTAVDLALSTDGGLTYPTAIATGLANTGVFAWAVPELPTSTARLRLTARDAAGNTTVVASAADFTIVSAFAGVAPLPRVLALAPPAPNPSRGATELRFALPADATARLDVLDVAGRRVAGLEQALPAGEHVWRWTGEGTDGARAPAGLYFVRLTTPFGNRVQRLVRAD